MNKIYRIMPWLLIALVIEIIIYAALCIEEAKEVKVTIDEVVVETEEFEGVVEEEIVEVKAATYTEEDVELLARLIYGEARGESYEGQVAVGAVVLNRVKTVGFPNTLEDVIFQKRQFTCVDDGQFWLDIPADSTVYQAARDALEGNDPTDGCVYYYNPKIATSSWIFENTVTMMVIGNHNFAVGK